ncbi:MAG TPA: thioredoxin family protein [Bacteroidales bacterium]|nr:thioredoxin family protein [Bacteroidales bacterium]
MDIKVLGTGCSKCKALEKITRETITEMGIPATVTKEEDIMKIMSYGIMNTPGLVIDGKVVLSGRIPSISEMKEILTRNK